MGVLDRFTPQQRQLLVIGVPVVGAFAVASAFRRRSEPVDDGPSGAPSGYTLPAMPSTNAIGVGELSQLYSLQTGQLLDIQRSIEQQTTQGNSTPPTSTSTRKCAPQPGTVAQIPSGAIYVAIGSNRWWQAGPGGAAQAQRLWGPMVQIPSRPSPVQGWLVGASNSPFQPGELETFERC